MKTIINFQLLSGVLLFCGVSFGQVSSPLECSKTKRSNNISAGWYLGTLKQVNEIVNKGVTHANNAPSIAKGYRIHSPGFAVLRKKKAP